MSRDPSKSRPLSANVKRMMWLERASPRSTKVHSAYREYTENDHIYCHKQGKLFMEAAAMGLSMEEFVPLYMTSQVASVIDYSFSTSNGMQDALTDLLQIPVLLSNPRALIESVYWIAEILENAKEDENKSLFLSKAFESELKFTPKALLALPEEENHSIEDLSYAYWLGYIYRCQCLMHEESSRMVYGAFSEGVMRKAYEEMKDKYKENLSDCAKEICKDLDQVLVEEIWPASNWKK